MDGYANEQKAMNFVISLGLDDELPMMVWADVALLYPHDYVLTPKARMVRATENKVQYLVSSAIKDVRQSLQEQKAQDYLAFRTLVVRRLCEHYGFVAVPSAKRVIITEEVEDVILEATPAIRGRVPEPTPRLEKIHEGGHPEDDRR